LIGYSYKREKKFRTTLVSPEEFLEGIRRFVVIAAGYSAERL